MDPLTEYLNFTEAKLRESAIKIKKNSSGVKEISELSKEQEDGPHNEVFFECFMHFLDEALEIFTDQLIKDKEMLKLS